MLRKMEHSSKLWSLLKKNGILVTALALVGGALAQTGGEIHAYLSSPGTVYMTRTEFIKADTISLSCDSCKVRSFSCAFTAKKRLKFKPYFGNKVPDEFKGYVKDAADSAVVTFEEIKIFDKGIAKDVPPFSITIVQ